jgi:hypothetical protein
MRGRVAFEDQTTAFQMLDARAMPTRAHVITFDATGAGSAMPPSTLRGARHSATGLICPRQISLGPELLLANPRILGASWSKLYATFDAMMEDHRGVALCEILDVRRLRWPLIGRLFERSFNLVSI